MQIVTPNCRFSREQYALCLALPSHEHLGEGDAGNARLPAAEAFAKEILV